MGALNATGHVLVASMGRNPDELWDLMGELAARVTGDEDAGPGIHALGSYAPERYCLHPHSDPDVEVRGDDLYALMLRGAYLLAGMLDETELWRRE